MQKREKYCGIIPALYACYERDGSISVGKTRELTTYFRKKGIKGLYVSGSSGECIYQSVEERKKVLKSVMQEAGGEMTVIAHVACNNTKDSRELAAYAESIGVDAIAAIPPIYFRLPDYAIAEYWNSISKAAPKTDFVIYNIPQLSGTCLTKELLRKMKENEKVIGVKNSSMPVQDIQIQKKEGGEEFIVFNGVDEQFVAGRMIGADGGIGGTYGVMPELFLKMDELLKNHENEKALEIQIAVNTIIEIMCSCHGNLYAVMKEILRKRETIDIGGVRAPLTAIHEEDMEKVDCCVQLINGAIFRHCQQNR